MPKIKNKINSEPDFLDSLKISLLDFNSNYNMA